MTWFVKFMETYPAVQAELRAILKGSFPGPSPPAANEVLKADIPYLDGVVEEGFRLAGTAKGNLPPSSGGHRDSWM